MKERMNVSLNGIRHQFPKKTLEPPRKVFDSLDQPKKQGKGRRENIDEMEKEISKSHPNEDWEHSSQASHAMHDTHHPKLRTPGSRQRQRQR